MVYTGVFASVADVEMKAGFGVCATAITASYVGEYLNEAESYINCVCRYNFSSAYGSLTDDTRGVLREAATNLAAIYAINYSLKGFSSRIEAEDKVNILRDAGLRGVDTLKDKKVSDFIRQVS